MKDPGPVTGLLQVDKPVGPTSHDIVARARRALGLRSIGHTGTLDPFASGLLLLCVGRATRLAEYLDSLDKCYLATVRVGRATATDDVEGETIRESDRWAELTLPEIEAALGRFRGPIRQVPPAYSAKKVGGEAMYRRARRGEVVELLPVEVLIHELELVRVALPELVLRIRCSTGTYVRAIARDLGEALEVGAHLTALRRTSIGRFRVEDAVPADMLDDPAQVAASWVEPADALGHLPSVEVREEEVARLAHGQPIERDAEDPEGESSGGPVVLVRDGSLVAVAFRRDRCLHPRKVFVDA